MPLRLGIRGRAAHLLAHLEAVAIRTRRKPRLIADVCPERNGHLGGKKAGDLAPGLDDSGCWFVERDELAHELRRVIRGDRLDEALDEAERCTRHRFDLLGTGERDWGVPPRWHQDLASGRVWPKHYHKRLLRELTGMAGSDVKIPWELSRFHHLLPLVTAGLLTGNPKYARAAVADIDSWIEDNPFRYGVNWTNPMEVAFRACNWIWAWWAFCSDVAWSPVFERKFLQSVWQHGWFIEHNLEDRGGVRTNHYLSDIVGLLFLGAMFRSFPDAERWRDFATRELVRCMDEMVLPDGVSFENSTAYHRLVLELFMFSAVLCRRNGIQLATAFWERLERMCEFVLVCTRPDGRMPMIGDADDGRLFPFTGYLRWERWDFCYLLAPAAVLFRRPDFKAPAAGREVVVAWLLGSEGVATWRKL
jgi:hypothetical protein